MIKECKGGEPMTDRLEDIQLNIQDYLHNHASQFDRMCSAIKKRGRDSASPGGVIKILDKMEKDVQRGCGAYLQAFIILRDIIMYEEE